MQILKFKSQLTFVFFFSRQSSKRPLRKQKFTSAGSKGHCLRFVIGGFQPVLYVSVFQGLFLVIKTMIDNRENAFVKAAFKLKSLHVFEKCSNCCCC